MSYEYQVGGSLKVDAPSYVKREADDNLYYALKAGKFCHILNCRQMGKSSLRVRTVQRLQDEGISCASIDLTTVGSNASQQQWYGGIIYELWKKFNLSGKVNLKTWLRDCEELSGVQRLSRFIEEMLLGNVPGEQLFIFIDEIDSVLSLEFSIDDFFAFIRACYNQRVDNREYDRLSFALFGVATPGDLIADKTRTPFNIGEAIALNGFQSDEVAPLTKGLYGKVEAPERVIKEILAWTGGQPFLTQKLCKLVVEASETQQFLSVEGVVRSRLIENWETQDEPEHLKTIRDRLFKDKQVIGRSLGLYQHILQHQEIETDGSPEQMYLRLSGLVVKKNGKLIVYNRVYREVFNREWVEAQLAQLRPYSEAIAGWLESKCQDGSWLLRGQALQDAREWADDKSLSDPDYKFLAASQEKERKLAILEAEIAHDAANKARQILTQAQRQAKQTIRRSLVGVAATLVLAISTVVVASRYAQHRLEIAREGTKLEQAGANALRQFESSEIEALLVAMESGRKLQSLVKKDSPLAEYPAISPLLALQMILNNIRERNQFKAHQGQVYSVSFSPDGQYIATVGEDGEDGTARLWNLSGQLIAELKGHQGFVYSVSFSPDGERIATAGQDSTARIWNLSGEQQAQIKTDQYRLYSLNFSPDGQQLVTAGEDGTIKLWNLLGQQLAQWKSHYGSIYQVSFSPDGKRLATAGQDGMVRLWNLSGEKIDELEGHRGSIYNLRFSPNGEHLATVGEDGTARVWDLLGKHPPQIWNGHGYRVYSVSWSPDGQNIATAGGDGKVLLWNLSGEQLAELHGHQGSVYSLSFSSDGQYLVSAGKDSEVRLWMISEKPQVQWQAHQGLVTSLSVSPDGQYVVTAGGDGKARLWNLSGELVVELNRSQSWAMSASFSSNGQFIVTASEEGKVQIWNVLGNIVTEFDSYQQGSWNATFSTDGKYLATIDKDRPARLWNISGELVAKLDNPQSWVASVTFSPDGQSLATAYGNGTVQLWTLSGEKLGSFQAHQGEVMDVSFSPDGQYIATAGKDSTAKLWNLSGEEQVKFMGHQGEVAAVSFSPDGQLIATAGEDGTVRLWLLSGQQVAQFGDGQNSIKSISFSSNGRQIFAGEADGVVRRWRVEALDEVLDRGCNWLQNYLTTHPNPPAVCHNQ